MQFLRHTDRKNISFKMVSVYHTFLFARISSSFLYYNVRWITRPAPLCNSLKFYWKKKKSSEITEQMPLMPIPNRFSSEYAVLLLESCVYSVSVCAGAGAPQRSTCTSEAPSGTGASVVFFPRYFLYLKAIDFFFVTLAFSWYLLFFHFTINSLSQCLHF